MYKVISLGAGVQSSTLFLMSCLGEIDRPDVAIFADTGAEPSQVYEHLEYLKGIGKEYCIPLEVVSIGNLGKDYYDLIDGKRTRVAAIPFFVKNGDGSQGMMRRQCTMDYKIVPLRRRAKELMIESGNKEMETWIGISVDEIDRMSISQAVDTRHICVY